MSFTRIKICGITRLQDAMIAVSLGVHALGFVFYRKSPRYVAIEQAQAIMAELPPFISKVGLFVNHTHDEVNTICDNLSLDTLQFHGDESPAFCEQFQKPYIKAIAMKDKVSLMEVSQVFSSSQALLLDTYSVEHYGGTGSVFDWDAIPNTLALPIILAGGLNSDNVREAIRRVHPYAVDVSSGVESMKGVKSEEKMREFCQVVFANF